MARRQGSSLRLAVRHFSGLGNQLFQYAAGRYYAQRYGGSLRMVIDPPQRAVSNGCPRPFLLSRFRIPVPAESLLLLGHRVALSPRWGMEAARRAAGMQVWIQEAEDRQTFQPELPVRSGVRVLFLEGYWQTYKTAEAVGPELRDELQFRESAVDKNRDMLERIQQCGNAISVHVRRGDYKLAAEGQRALPLAYYAKGMAYFQERLSDPVFFVFSDEIAWARENLPRDAPMVFVDHNDDFSSHEDLRLMSGCRHHVIANSTFSWWGAWLNPRPDRVVVAPKHWRMTAGSYYPDLLPPDWVLFDSDREAFPAE
jgi:hypothetical protein